MNYDAFCSSDRTMKSPVKNVMLIEKWNPKVEDLQNT
jgi:hypothetical protein